MEFFYQYWTGIPFEKAASFDYYLELLEDKSFQEFWVPPELKCQTGLFTFCVEISAKLSSEAVQYTTEHTKRKITQP